MYSVCCGRLLLGRLLIVERERAVRAWQLLDIWQRHECGVHCVPCRGLLPFGVGIFLCFRFFSESYGSKLVLAL